jgi:hypothetical protein
MISIGKTNIGLKRILNSINILIRPSFQYVLWNVLGNRMKSFIEKEEYVYFLSVIVDDGLFRLSDSRHCGNAVIKHHREVRLRVHILKHSKDLSSVSGTLQFLMTRDCMLRK